MSRSLVQGQRDQSKKVCLCILLAHDLPLIKRQYCFITDRYILNKDRQQKKQPRPTS